MGPAITPEQREAIRRRYEFRCGYCGVHESEIGSELEIDHFRPLSKGGTDDLDNLVYACPACNRIKGDFWPAEGEEVQRLLHPLLDDVDQHYYQASDGTLLPVTATGAFHISRLRLNRAPLITLRNARLERARLYQELESVRKENTELQSRILQLEKELTDLLDLLSMLLSSDTDVGGHHA